MEDQEDRLVLLRSNSILDILLMLTEKFGVELDITGLVDPVNITESGGDREVWGDWRESLVDGKNILGLSVQRVVVDILVVDTIFLTSSNTNFLDNLSIVEQWQFAETYHLEPLLHWRSALEVLGSGLNVEVDFLLTQVNHV